MEDCLQQKYAKMTIIQNHHRTTNRGTVALMLFVNGDEKHKRCIRTVPYSTRASYSRTGMLYQHK